jgi:hypothetical protein
MKSRERKNMNENYHFKNFKSKLLSIIGIGILSILPRLNAVTLSYPVSENILGDSSSSFNLTSYGVNEEKNPLMDFNYSGNPNSTNLMFSYQKPQVSLGLTALVGFGGNEIEEIFKKPKSEDPNTLTGVTSGYGGGYDQAINNPSRISIPNGFYGNIFPKPLKNSSLNFSPINIDPIIPEPETSLLIGGGGIALGLKRKRVTKF